MNNNFYENMIEESPIGYAYNRIICNEEGTPCDYEFVEVNAAFEALIGLMHSDIIEKRATEILKGLKVAGSDAIKVYGDIALNGGKKEIEFIQVLNKCYRVIIYSLEKNYFITQFIDVSKSMELLTQRETKIEYLEIERQKNFLNSIIDAIPDMIFLKDREGKFIACNKAFANNIARLEKEEVIGKTDFDIFKEIPQANKNRKQDKEVMDSEKSQINYITIKTSEGNTDIEYIKTPFYNDNMEVIGIVGIARDISLRKSAEEKISRISQRLKMATKAANVGIWEYDIDKKTFVWDEAMYKLYDIIEGSFSVDYETWEQSLLHDDLKRIRSNINDAFLGKSDFNPEFRISWKDGSIHHLKADAVVLRDEQGNPTKMFGTNRDITEHVQYKAELVKEKELAESANIMKSQFLANMSHEIRTPMNGILGYLELLRSTRLSEEQEKFLGGAKSASEILLYLINDILDFSKIEAGKLTIENRNFSIITVVEDAVSNLVPKAYEKHVGLHTLISANVPEEVIGDSSRIRQVLNNLISNAVKFTEKGEINVNVNCGQEIGGNALLCFEIKDTGIGISEDKQKKLFKPFTQADPSTTRKFGGTGLGLVISKQLVKLMQGDISVKSEVNKGSIFRFTLLLEISKRSNEGSVFEKLEANGSDKANTTSLMCSNNKNLKPEILLVEDNEMNRKIFSTMLKHRNMTCDVALDGSEAVATLTKKHYDIIFMDCQMPVMDGYESTARIRALEGSRKHTPIIAMTANAMIGDRERCIKAGMDEYITKPINFDTIFNVIESIINSRVDNCFIEDNINNFMAVTGLKKDNAKELFTNFIKYLPKVMENIRKALEDNDCEKIQKLAHQLKGSSGSLRINSIYELAKEMEESALNKEIKKCANLLMEIKKLLN